MRDRDASGDAGLAKIEAAADLVPVLDRHLQWVASGWESGKRADLHGRDLHDIDLHDALLSDADLHRADLHAAVLGGCELLGADLHRCDLHGADLRGADLRQVRGLTRAQVLVATVDAGTRLPTDFDAA